MNAPVVPTQSKVRTAGPNLLKFKKECEMRLMTKMTKVKKLLSTGIATQHPVKLLLGLALGALLVAGMGLSLSSTDADNPGSPSSESASPRWDEIAYPHWEEDDADHIPYGVDTLQYLGIVVGTPSSEDAFPRWDEIAYPHWEDDDADRIPYGVDTLQYLGITD